MKTRSIKTAKGFTLIELLVAMAITTVIITILVSITSLSLDTWNRSRSEIRAARQGKAMIDSMSRDFESMVTRKGNNFEWLFAKYSPTDTGPKDNGNASPNAADLVFFSAATDRYNGEIGVADRDNGGDVSTVAYTLAYKDPIDGSSEPGFMTFVLYRKIINPDTTFANTLGIPFVAADEALLDAAVSAAPDKSITSPDIDDTSNFICENIYQFSLTFHVNVTKPDGTIASVPVPLGNGSDSTKTFKVAGSGLYMDSNVAVPSGVTIDMVKAGRLSSVEVSLTVLTDFGLAQMRKRTFSGSDKDEFIAENSYQYSKLIPVPGS